MNTPPRTKALKADQLKGELKGDLAAYEKFGLFQRSVNQNTAYRYRGALLRYQVFLGETPPSLPATYEYLGSLRKNGFDPATLRVYRAALSGYHQFRGEELKFKVKVPDTSAKYVPWEIIQKMLALAAAKPHDELILRLMADGGLRRDEVVNLKISNIEGNSFRFRGKGDKQRTVPMTAELRKLVEQFSAGRPKNEPLVELGEKGVYLLVKRYGALAGMPAIAPHDLRRSFGTHLLKVTGNIRIVQEILGHSNVNTTQSYTAVTLSDMEEAVKRLNESAGNLREKGSSVPIVPDTGFIRPRLLEGHLLIKTAPQPQNPKNLTSEAMCCQNISIKAESSEIEIMSIEITNSDADVGYMLLLFVNEAPYEIGEWDTEKIWASGIVKSRLHTFKFRDGLNYKDFSKTNLIHGGLELGYRPMRCDLPFEEDSRKMREYYTKPIELDVVVRYRLSE
jgi:site-specific recombinase XerD